MNEEKKAVEAFKSTLVWSNINERGYTCENKLANLRRIYLTRRNKKDFIYEAGVINPYLAVEMLLAWKDNPEQEDNLNTVGMGLEERVTHDDFPESTQTQVVLSLFSALILAKDSIVDRCYQVLLNREEEYIQEKLKIHQRTVIDYDRLEEDAEKKVLERLFRFIHFEAYPRERIFFQLCKWILDYRKPDMLDQFIYKWSAIPTIKMNCLKNLDQMELKYTFHYLFYNKVDLLEYILDERIVVNICEVLGLTRQDYYKGLLESGSERGLMLIFEDMKSQDIHELEALEQWGNYTCSIKDEMLCLLIRFYSILYRLDYNITRPGSEQTIEILMDYKEALMSFTARHTLQWEKKSFFTKKIRMIIIHIMELLEDTVEEQLLLVDWLGKNNVFLYHNYTEKGIYDRELYKRGSKYLESFQKYAKRGCDIKSLVHLYMRTHYKEGLDLKDFVKLIITLSGKKDKTIDLDEYFGEYVFYGTIAYTNYAQKAVHRFDIDTNVPYTKYTYENSKKELNGQVLIKSHQNWWRPHKKEAAHFKKRGEIVRYTLYRYNQKEEVIYADNLERVIADEQKDREMDWENYNKLSNILDNIVKYKDLRFNDAYESNDITTMNQVQYFVPEELGKSEELSMKILQASCALAYDINKVDNLYRCLNTPNIDCVNENKYTQGEYNLYHPIALSEINLEHMRRMSNQLMQDVDFTEYLYIYMNTILRQYILLEEVVAHYGKKDELLALRAREKENDTIKVYLFDAIMDARDEEFIYFKLLNVCTKKRCRMKASELMNQNHTEVYLVEIVQETSAGWSIRVIQRDRYYQEWTIYKKAIFDLKGIKVEEIYTTGKKKLDQLKSMSIDFEVGDRLQVFMKELRELFHDHRFDSEICMYLLEGFEHSNPLEFGKVYNSRFHLEGDLSREFARLINNATIESSISLYMNSFYKYYVTLNDLVNACQEKKSDKIFNRDDIEGSFSKYVIVGIYNKAEQLQFSQLLIGAYEVINIGNMTFEVNSTYQLQVFDYDTITGKIMLKLI